MTYLIHEQERLQLELQATDAGTTELGKQLQLTQQAAAAAAARVTAAQASLAAAQAQIPALQAKVTQTEARLADIDQMIADTSQEPEPDRTNMLKQLRKQRFTAEQALVNARTGLSTGRALVNQRSGELQSAQNQSNSAAAAVSMAQAAVDQRHQLIQAELARISRWNAAITADPLNRRALESMTQELAERAADLEQAADLARLRLETDLEALVAFRARRDAISAELKPIVDALSGKAQELQIAQQNLEAIAQQMSELYQGGP
jgi:chromosome segregation ATPase